MNEHEHIDPAHNENVFQNQTPAEPVKQVAPLIPPAENAASDQSASPTANYAADAIPETLYRWTYAEQIAHDKKTARSFKRNGILVYALVMTGVFLVSFGLLIAVLLVGGNNTSIGGGIIRPGVSNPADDIEAVVGVEKAKRSVVVIEVKTETGGGTGTGIIMTSDGYIATNHHVIDGATKIKVTFYDGTVMQAEFIGSSEMDDLGVIKVDGHNLPAATFAYSNTCYVGQTVYAIGTPAGPDFGWTTTRGIISYVNRELKIYDDTDGTLEKKLRLLQMDSNVNPGNSGGPLINTNGEVVGIVSMKLANGYEGIGFAIPSDGAVEILEAIRLYGNADSINSSLHHKRPMLGITGVFMNGGAYYLPDENSVLLIPEDELGNYNLSDLIHPPVSGIYIMGLAEGMDAATKIKLGDIITAAEGEEIESMDHLMNILDELYVGDTITLTVYRDGNFIAVDIVLSAKPD